MTQLKVYLNIKVCCSLKKGLWDFTFFPIENIIIRYYEKSRIEEEISQLRTKRQENWQETKRSIKDARYRLSLQRNSLQIDDLDNLQHQLHSSEQNKSYARNDKKMKANCVGCRPPFQLFNEGNQVINGLQ